MTSNRPSGQTSAVKAAVEVAANYGTAEPCPSEMLLWQRSFPKLTDPSSIKQAEVFGRAGVCWGMKISMWWDAAKFDGAAVRPFLAVSSMSVREKKTGAGQYLALT